jgi:propionyl-CoA carboxylase alpha chain
MRVAWNDAECRENFKLCKQEAMSSFGNDEMLVEKVLCSKKKNFFFFFFC